jgi:hypothetical protein
MDGVSIAKFSGNSFNCYYTATLYMVILLTLIGGGGVAQQH